MPIDNKRFKKLEKGFKLLEEYDNLGGHFPYERVKLNVTIPISLKRELERKAKTNLSRYVEKILDEHLSETRKKALSRDMKKVLDDSEFTQLEA